MFGKKTVKIDRDLCKKAEGALPSAGYASVSELVEHAVEKLLEELDQRDRDDEQTLQERLRGLGYISRTRRFACSALCGTISTRHSARRRVCWSGCRRGCIRCWGSCRFRSLRAS